MSSRNGTKHARDSNGRSSTRVNSLREITISYEGRDETIVVKPPNLSKGGMFINTSRNFPEGAVLNLRFELLLTGATIETRCEVRHCRPGIGVGVQFIGLSREAAQLIEQEIACYHERAASPTPRRVLAKAAAPIRQKRHI